MKYKKSITNCRLSTHKSSNITLLLILLYSIFSNFSCNDNKKIEELLNEEKSLRKEIDKTKEKQRKKVTLPAQECGHRAEYFFFLSLDILRGS